MHLDSQRQKPAAGHTHLAETCLDTFTTSVWASALRAKPGQASGAVQGRYLSRRLATEDTSDGPGARATPQAGSLQAAARERGRDSQQTEHLKELVHDAYAELEDLYSWLRRSGIGKPSATLEGAPRPQAVAHGRKR